MKHLYEKTHVRSEIHIMCVFLFILCEKHTEHKKVWYDIHEEVLNVQKILIVEDDRDIQELLQEFLKEAGYMVDIAVDGVEAIAMFNANTYDLILLDIMLPKITGYSVCELVRKQSQVPIIMLTALDSESDQIKGLDLQADDYITKPFSMPILMRKIAAVLRRSNRNNDNNTSIYYT